MATPVASPLHRCAHQPKCPAARSSHPSHRPAVSEGSTSVADETWTGIPAALRPYERTVLIGDSEEHWHLASEAVLRWGVKTRSGFTARPTTGTELQVVDGADHTLVAAVGPLRILGPWRAAYPLILLAQRWYRRRYIHAMRSIVSPHR